MKFPKFKCLVSCFLLTIASLCPVSIASVPEPEPAVSNSFFDTDIREALRDIAAQTGVKIVADEAVQGTISIELKDVPLEQALDMILSIGNYAYRKMPEDYYLVGSSSPNSPSFDKLSVTHYFQPNYLKAEELQSLIAEYYQPYLKVNKEINRITVTATPKISKRILMDLAMADVAPRQVMIEALVVELSSDDKKTLGITWGSMLDGGFSIYPPSNIVYSRNSDYTTTYGTSGTTPLPDLFAKIDSLLSNGTAKIRANPRIATLEGKTAEISVGNEEYFVINVASGNSSFATLQSVVSGVVLKITPFLDQKNRITVEIAPQVSEVASRGSNDLPVVTRRMASTALRVNDAQTIAIGGLIQEQSRDQVSKVPLLGSIPLLGGLFRSTHTETVSKEVVIFITPRILNNETMQPNKPGSLAESLTLEQVGDLKKNARKNTR